MQKYKYLNTTYNIKVKKDKKESFKLDNKSQINNYILLQDDKKTHEIELTNK